MKKKISMILLASIISSNASPMINVFAGEVSKEKEEIIKTNAVSTAKITNFSLKNYNNFENYNLEYRVQREDILSISNNGGKYGSSYIDKAIDGNLSTHWETGKANGSNFTNEVIVEFKNLETIDRIAYATRQDNAKGKGYPTKFEIHASVTGEDKDFKLVSEGSSSSTGNMMEFKFDAINAKKIKFVFAEANQNWASASEFWFYREDKIIDKLNSIFTDDSMSKVSEDFSSIEKLEALEEEIKTYPLYDEYKERIQVAKDLVNVKPIVSSEAKVRKFELQNSEYISSYNNSFKLDNSKILSITNNGGNYGSSVISRAIDGNLNTHWETGKANSSTFKNEIILTLNELTELNRIVYAARQDSHKGRGFATKFDIYASSTTKGDNFQLVTSGESDLVQEVVEIKFEPTEFRRIKFVFKETHGSSLATASEIMLYKEDKITDKVNSVFEDTLYTELSEEYNTISKLENLENELTNHPLKNDHMKIINLAKQILNGGTVESSEIITLSQRGNENVQKNERRQIFAGGNLDLTGYYIAPGESVEIYVDADKNSVLPQLVFSQVGEVDGVGNHKRSLQIGKNIVTAPDGTKPFAIYFSNKALPEEQAYAPRVRIAGDNLNEYPIYIHGKTDPEEYIKQVKNHKGANMTDVMGERFLISGKNSEAYVAYVDRGKSLLDAVDAFDRLIEAFDKLAGYDENDPNPIHRPSKALYHYKGSTASGLYASNEYIHYAGYTAKDVFAGNFRDWGIGHEFGHQIENKDMRLLEVTNNLFSIASHKSNLGYVGRNFSWNQGNIDNYFTFEGTKGFGGFGQTYDLTFGLFERLLVLVQVTNYFGDEAYANACRLVRENPSRYNATGSYQSIITAMSEATGYDLSSHFEYYNYPVTDKTKEFTSQFKDLDKKIRYTTIDTYKMVEDNVQTFGKSTKAVINNVKQESDGFTFSIGTSDNNEGTIAYEIYRDGKLVGFTRENTYKDTVDSSKSYEYQIIAYDYRVNESKSDIFSTSSIIYLPSLNVENTINIEQNSEFNALDYVQATTFDNKEIDKSKIVVTSNVDTKNTGRYEVSYEVEDRGCKVSKTASVVVYEKLNVKKSMYNEFDNLTKYNEEFKIPVVSISNNGKHYGSSVISRAIDGNLSTHWETGTSNSSTFKNEVTFDFGEVQEISKMAYAARRDAGGKGFAYEFEIYASDDASGDNFYLVGEGTYRDRATDVVEFSMSNVNARRIKFKFVEANQNWASLSEVSFYKKDKLSDKIENELFTDSSRNEVGEKYNTLEKLEALRGEIKNHPAYSVLNKEIARAEEILKAKLPVITASEVEFVKLNSEFDLMTGVSANDQEDGNITDNVQVDTGNFNIGKTGKYTIAYRVTDSDGNVTTKERTVLVYSKLNYISDIDCESAVSGWRDVNKDMAVGTANKIKLNIDGTIKEFDKGLGVATNAEIVYNLDGEYSHFSTYLGTDKNYNHNSTSIIFKIFADGKEVYTSGLIRKDSKAEFVSIDVTGVKELKLVADNADGNGLGDFASWADTKLYSMNSKPGLTIPSSVSTKIGQEIDINGEYSAIDAEDGDITENVEVTGLVNFNKSGKYPITYTVTDSDGNKVSKTRSIAVVDMEDYKYLTDYDWKSTTNSYRAPKKDQSNSGNTLRLTDENGEVVTYERGIGAHSTSTIIYDLSDKDYSYFSAYVGVDRAMYGSVGSVTFEVYVDGQKRFDSGLMNSRDLQKYVEVDINEAKELKLVVTDGGNGNGSDHAIWGDTKLHFAQETVAEKPEVEELRNLIQYAQTLDRSMVGANRHADSKWSNFEIVLEKSKVDLEDESKTVEEIKASIRYLQYVIDELEIIK